MIPLPFKIGEEYHGRETWSQRGEEGKNSDRGRENNNDRETERENERRSKDEKKGNNIKHRGIISYI